MRERALPELPEEKVISPCSVPAWLRALVPVEDEAWQRCCKRHDGKYERGGTETERLIADVEFFLDMLREGVDPVWAERYYHAVRMFGSLHWKQKQPCRVPDLTPSYESP
jgi:hypothetical protein